MKTAKQLRYVSMLNKTRFILFHIRKRFLFFTIFIPISIINDMLYDVSDLFKLIRVKKIKEADCIIKCVQKLLHEFQKSEPTTLVRIKTKSDDEVVNVKVSTL